MKSGFLNRLSDESLLISCHDLWIDLWIVVSLLCSKMFFPFIRNELLILSLRYRLILSQR